MADFEAYVICTSPRSGSTLLCKLLVATGVAGLPASHFHEAMTDIEAELLDVGIVVEVRLFDEIVDFLLSVRGGSGGGFDHGGRLHVGELFNAALALNDVAHFER